MKTQEQILREALAFILVQAEMGESARLIAHKALRAAYGDEIAGKSLAEYDRILAEQIKLADELINELIEEDRRKAQGNI